MPTILSICQSPVLGETRRLLLAKRGHNVLDVTDVRELEKIEQNPDCAVIGRDIEPRMKRAVAGLLEQKWPGLAILEINVIHPEIDGAASVSTDAPEEVLHALNDLLLPTGFRYSAHLHRKSKGILERARRAILRSEELASRIAQQREKSRRLLGADDHSQKRK